MYFFIISFIISLLFFYLYSRPKKTQTPNTPFDFKLNYEDIELNTIDGIKISGWFIPNKDSNKAIIMLHGWPADKGDILANTFFMSKKYNLLYIDFRAMGKSGGKINSGGYKEVLDIKAAIEYLKKRGLKDIALYGYSMGGFAAIFYSINYNDIKVVISDSPYDNIYAILKDFFKFYWILAEPILWFMNFEYKILYGKFITELSISKNIEKIKTPTLFICGDKDDICYSKSIEGYNSINDKIETVILKDFSHNESIYYRGYEKIVMEFLQRRFE